MDRPDRPNDLTREPVRRVARLMTAMGLTALTGLLLAGPALADDPTGRKEGADPGKGLDPLVLVLLYVAVPIGFALLVAAVVWLPSAVKANRYRPTKPWTAKPVWFAGPADPVAAVQSASVGDVTRGGSGGSW